MVNRVLLGYVGWLLGCCYAVAMVLWVFARAVARVPGLVARMLLCGTLHFVNLPQF